MVLLVVGLLALGVVVAALVVVSSREEETPDPGERPEAASASSPTPDEAGADTPAGVVEAFLTAVGEDDCPTAEQLISRDFVAHHGSCGEGVPSEFTWTLGAETVDARAGHARVETVLAPLEPVEGEPARLPAAFVLTETPAGWVIDDIQ